MFFESMTNSNLFENEVIFRDYEESAVETAIWRALLKIANHGPEVTLSALARSPIGLAISRAIREKRRLRFVLPAFPAKSPNPEKTSGMLPDLGEVLGLKRLQEFCEEIQAVFAPGAEVIICSDGRVFNDLVLVSEEDLLAYQATIKEIIEHYGLTGLKTFSLDDCWSQGALSFAQMRSHLTQNYAPCLEELKTRVKASVEFRQLFNGIHRFVSEDRRVLFQEKSRNAISVEAKEVAYQVIRRSNAWDALLAEKFPETLRLSIHPYPITHAKFGVRLVPGMDRWGTPWHNVTVKRGDDFFLMKRSEALAQGAKLKHEKERYAYYEI